MIRILGIFISSSKKLFVALQAIYGIGYTTAHNVLKLLNINPFLTITDLTDNQISSLREFLLKMKLEGDLKRQVKINIKHLITINCFRGKRHLKGLPVRGQRTHTNRKTCRKLILY